MFWIDINIIFLGITYMYIAMPIANPRVNVDKILWNLIVSKPLTQELYGNLQGFKPHVDLSNRVLIVL